MAEIINLNKKVYGKITYPNVISTQFTQLIGAIPPDPTPSLTIDQFFKGYDDLFFEIPTKGNSHSHEELIKRSTEYAGESTSDEIEALLNEINQLRIENLTLQQTIDGLITSR